MPRAVYGVKTLPHVFQSIVYAAIFLRGETFSIVADADSQDLAFESQAHVDLRGDRVLQDIIQRLLNRQKQMVPELREQRDVRKMLGHLHAIAHGRSAKEFLSVLN